MEQRELRERKGEIGMGDDRVRDWRAGVLGPGGEGLDFTLSAVVGNEGVKAGNSKIAFVAEKEQAGLSTEKALESR